MNKYKISCYKIWWDNGINDLYVGSTKQVLSMRMAGHRRKTKSGGSYNIYNAIRTNGYDFNYVLLQSYEVSCKDEQLKWEQKWIDEIHPNLNKNRAHRSPEYSEQYKKQWYQDNKDIILERDKIRYQIHKDKILVKCKQYRENNKDKIKSRSTKIECECGIIIGKYKLHRHLRTQIHKKKINMYYLGLLPFQ